MTSLSSYEYEFSAPCTTLPHTLIKDQLIDLIEIILQLESLPSW